MKRKLFVVLTLAFVLLPFFQMNTASSQETNISIVVDGRHIFLDRYPILKEGRTLVPLRAISEAMNAAVHWNEANQKITISKGTIKNELVINSNTAHLYSSGLKSSIYLDVPPTIINERTFVPVRYIAESFGAHVLWDETSKLITIDSPNVLKINSKTIAIGDRLEEVTKQFGKPDRIDMSAYDFDWYIFGQNTEDYLMVAIKDNIVTGYFTCSRDFIVNDVIKFGDPKKTVEANLTLNRQIAYYDQHNNDTLHGIGYIKSHYDMEKYMDNIEKIGKAHELQIFDLTNVFRLQHKLPVLKSNSIADKTAKLHSQDLADYNYFSHTGKDGSSPTQRYHRLGGEIRSGAGENIAAGRNTGIGSFYAWVNSLGHRNNMLHGAYTELGVGEGYNANSQYRFYHTQIFILNW